MTIGEECLTAFQQARSGIVRHWPVWILLVGFSTAVGGKELSEAGYDGRNPAGGDISHGATKEILKKKVFKKKEGKEAGSRKLPDGFLH